MRQHRTSWNFWAPERFDNARLYDLKSDIWSLGITLTELALGNYPYTEELSGDMHFFNIYDILRDTDSKEIIEKVRLIGCSDDFCSFLECGLRKNPVNRYSAIELKSTNWYKKFECANASELFMKVVSQLNEIEVKLSILNSVSASV